METEKERVLGKLQMLEVLADMIQNFRETYTRLLVVNEVEPTDENTSKDSQEETLEETLEEILEEVKIV